MFDCPPSTCAPPQAAASVLFLSSPFGAAREWRGISECLGRRAVCRTFGRGEEFRRHAQSVSGASHLVAHGTGACHALRVALECPKAVRSVTLIDPDIIRALPDLTPCLQFRGHLGMIRRAIELHAANRHDDAAALVTDWWMGRQAWARTAARLRQRFANAVPAMVLEWRSQSSSPLLLHELAALSCPMRILTGRRVRSDITALSRFLRLAVPEVSLTRVAAARAASHLTAPHVVAPEIANFVASNEMAWQTEPVLVAA